MRITSTLLGLAMLSGCAVQPTSSDSSVASLEAPAATRHDMCLTHLREHHSDNSLAARQRKLENEISDYLRLAEEALSLRARAIQLYSKRQADAKAGLPLTGDDLRQLGEGTKMLLAQRDALMAAAEAHECWLDLPVPGDDRDLAIRAGGIAMSLSAALLLYDNYLTAIAPFWKDGELRRLLNSTDRGFGISAGTLNAIAVNFSSLENRRRTRRAAEWLQANANAAAKESLEHYAYLLASIEQSPSLALVRRTTPLRDMASALDFLGSLTFDGALALKDESTNLSSLLFGNAIGLVETRRGKLYNQPEITRQVEASLKAGDILLEKTPFRLTDTFIPGHWGHAAIWIGTADELRALGIWDHPVVRPFQAEIIAGRGVVEALRTGVRINPIEHFLNVDDLAVLRPTNLDREAQAQTILYTLRQVGKPYDFNFDAETTDRIFCSKLVYLAYGGLQWPTSRMLGRVTVSPDDIASRAVGDGPLSIALLYHDGREIGVQPHRTLIELLQSAKLTLARREQQRRLDE